MKIFIDDISAVELSKSKIVESDVQDWINCYRELYPKSHIYYRGM